MRMKAAVLEEFGKPLVVQDVDLAEPKAGEVLVRVVACGVCHTDLYTASGADPTGYAPAVLGHEGAGVVEKVGDGVTLTRGQTTMSWKETKTEPATFEGEVHVGPKAATIRCAFSISAGVGAKASWTMRICPG